MSDVKVVRYLLANNAPLVAAVPATRIMAGALPQGCALPAISISHISTVRQQLISAGASQMCTARVQVTVHASSYKSQKDVLALVRTALPRTHGTVNGVAVDRLVHNLDGPDFRDDTAGIFMGSVDYIVGFTE
jgi:hypothetical protein